MEVYLDNVRIAFADGLWTPKSGTDPAAAAAPGAKAAYQCAFLIPRSATETVQNVLKSCLAAAQAKWGDKAQAMYDALRADNKLCIHDGNAKPDYAGYPGNLYINARAYSLGEFVIVDRDGKTRLTQSSGRPYSGCFVNALIDIWCQQNQHGKRINASLKIVQFRGDGDAFGGSRPPTAEQLARFGDLSGEGIGDLNQARPDPFSM